MEEMMCYLISIDHILSISLLSWRFRENWIFLELIIIKMYWFRLNKVELNK